MRWARFYSMGIVATLMALGGGIEGRAVVAQPVVLQVEEHSTVEIDAKDRQEIELERRMQAEETRRLMAAQKALMEDMKTMKERAEELARLPRKPKPQRPPVPTFQQQIPGVPMCRVPTDCIPPGM